MIRAGFRVIKISGNLRRVILHPSERKLRGQILYTKITKEKEEYVIDWLKECGLQLIRIYDISKIEGAIIEEYRHGEK
ncbi:MAG: hypothetical protein Q6363_005295 [Candidatus Njordarchaeota archaeon]